MKRSALSRGDKPLQRRAPLRASVSQRPGTKDPVTGTAHPDAIQRSGGGLSPPPGSPKARREAEKELARRGQRVNPSRTFRRAVSRRPCVVCATTSVPRDPHHLVSQRAIRDVVMAMRLPGPEARKLLGRLLSDTRNGVALCRLHHEQVTKCFLFLTREQIPAVAWEFAQELGPWAVARLERSLR